MKIELAAFRLHALSLLTSNGNSSTAGITSAHSLGAGGGSFIDVLTQAQHDINGAALAKTGLTPASAAIGSGTERAEMLLARLEDSNRVFLRNYNARVAEIGDEAQVLQNLRARLQELGEASATLTTLAPSASDDRIVAAVRDFVAQYNAWDSEFDPYFARGGLLEGNQAGEVARFSMRREVGWQFHGAGNGGFGQGLTDMGLSFDAGGQLRLDERAFSAALAADRQAAVRTLSNMATAFGESAQLLASDGHLLDRRIDNANRAVDWAERTQAEVEAEFGPGASLAQRRQ